MSDWISVEDRLPETIPCKTGKDYSEYSEAVVLLTSGRKVLTGILVKRPWGYYWVCDAEFWEAEGEEITHWKSVLPLLKPLKEALIE